jgi:hypothetical protein
MDVERIERALREGPVGEPRYVPGSFAGRARRGWSFAMVSAAVGAALVLGLVVGVGLQVVRGPSGEDQPADLVALRGDIQGRWASDVIDRQQWIDGLVSRGHELNDLEAYFQHDPLESEVQYFLAFRPNQLIIMSAADGGPENVLTAGTYDLLPDGRLTWQDEGGTALSDPCVMTAEPELEGERLTFRGLATTGCTADEAIAMSAFFDLAAYGRTE